MARHAVIDLCLIFRLPPTPPRVDRLLPEEERRLATFLAGAGVRLRADAAGLAEFAALRATYEPYVQALSSFLLMPLPAWVPAVEPVEARHTIA